MSSSPPIKPIQIPTRSLTTRHRNKNNREMMACRVNHLFFLLLSLISVSMIAQSADDCVYTVYVRTGSIWKAGTDSIMSLTLSDPEGYSISIPNLETWGGLMGPDYDYFERGNLDIFSGRGKCLDGPICSMNITSDGLGAHHGWYCNYVEVTATGAHIPCAQQLFTVEQWLATDHSPYELTATRSVCPTPDPVPEFV